jgi:hypothetical protein
MCVYAAYWALSVRRALRVRLYRNQALGIGLVALCFAIFFGIIGVPPDFYNTDYPVVSVPFFYLAFLVTFFWIDSSILAARRSDPHLRDTFRWSILQIIIWTVNIVGAILVLAGIAYLQITTGTVPSSPPLIALILELTPFYGTLLAGSIFLPIIARRSKDLLLRKHLTWFGLFAIVIAVFIGGGSQVFGNSFWSITAQNVGVLIGGFFLYLAAKSLVPLNRLQLVAESS